jgi:hypothetical protein
MLVVDSAHIAISDEYFLPRLEHLPSTDAAPQGEGKMGVLIKAWKISS